MSTRQRAFKQHRHALPAECVSFSTKALRHHLGIASPAPLRDCLSGHFIQTAHELGWSELKNGELLTEAEKRFDLLVTTDRHLRFQQNLADRRLAVLVLPTTNWPQLRTETKRIAAAVNSLKPGQYLELTL